MRLAAALPFLSLALLFTLTFTVASPALAQRDRLPVTDVEQLGKLEQDARARWEARRGAAFRDLTARATGPMAGILNDPGTYLQGVDPSGRPILYTTQNLDAARTSGVEQLWPGGASGFDLTGAGPAGELALWDGGGVRTTHVEFEGRVTILDSPGGLSSHATHVAATMGAAGIDPSAHGMAPDALIHSYDFFDDAIEMPAAAATGLRLSNHSYGFITGWYYSSSETAWYWYGYPEISETEDPGFGMYDGAAAEYDAIALAAPYYLIVKSAGNDRNDFGPGPGGEHFAWIDGGWQLSTTTRDFDGGDDGYDSISWRGTAKNIVTVGAVQDITAGWSVASDVVPTSFTGWGPTDDGRIKPDLVANGAGLYSAVATGDTDYASYSGTSMSSPTATGTAQLIRRHYEDVRGATPLASTMKGILLHTAHEAGPAPGPDYQNGWGLLDGAGAAEFVADPNSQIVEDTLDPGEMLSWTFDHDGSGDVRVTIAWTDPVGPVDPSFTLNPTTVRLVNDLDVALVSESSGDVYLPWTLDPSLPDAPAVRDRNARDNVERIDVAGLAPGSYRVEISHTGALASSQTVSMLASGLTVPVEYDVEVASILDSTPGSISVYSALNGTGDRLDDAFLWDGDPGNTPVRVDATISVTVRDAQGDPVVGLPAESITLRAAADGWVACDGVVAIADGPTDASGTTTFSGTLQAGGYSAPDELLQVVVDGAGSTTYGSGEDGLRYAVNSPDLILSGMVDLGDIGQFASDFGGPYAYRSDFIWNGVIDLQDIGVLALAIGTACPAPVTREVVAERIATEEIGLVFADDTTTVDGLEPGRVIDARLVLRGPAAASGVHAFDTRLRTTENVRVRSIELAGDGFDLAADDDLVVGIPKGVRSAADAQVVLARVRLAVTDDAPAYVWLEPSTVSGDALPTVAHEGTVYAARPASGSIADPVVRINESPSSDATPGLRVDALAVDVAPNPFNPKTTIRCRVPQAGPVVVRIFDVRGQRVASLHDGALAEGTHDFTWNGVDDAGSPVASGVYFVDVRTVDGGERRKIMLVK